MSLIKTLESVVNHQQLVAQASTGIIVIDSQDTILYCNAQGAKMLAYNAYDIIGKPLHTLIPQPHIMQQYRTIKRVVLNNQVEHSCLCFTTKQQTPLDVGLQAVPYRNQSAHIKGVTLYLNQDSTQNYPTTNHEVRKLQTDLQKVKRELNNFTYIISHDLNAPIRGAMSLSNWLAEDYTEQLDEDGQEQLRLLNERLHRLSDMVNGVLQYSRIGRWMKDPTDIDLRITLRKIVTECLRHHTDVNVIYPDYLPLLFADEVRIYQLFDYLIRNAVQFNNAEQKQIKINYAITQQKVVFCVSDNGIGIKEKDLDKTFKIFQTLDSKTDNVGIGLTLAKKIVELYEGNIWIESKYGEGTKVFFTLPNALAM
ncbi:MAG: ATP-binding protein [Chitinophagales bacterium]